MLDIIEAILKKARLQYNKHCLGKLWLVHGKGGGSGKGGYYANPCFNCDEAHSLHVCTKPKDDARIAKNRNDYMEKKKQEGRNNVPRKNNSNSKGDRSNNGDYKRKQWAAAGLHKVRNKLMMNCRDCGNNMTHGSSSHHKWAANPSAYKLSSSHPLVRHNKDLGHDVPTSGGIPPSIKSGDTVQTDLTGSTSSADSLLIRLNTARMLRKQFTWQINSMCRWNWEPYINELLSGIVPWFGILELHLVSLLSEEISLTMLNAEFL